MRTLNQVWEIVVEFANVRIYLPVLWMVISMDAGAISQQRHAIYMPYVMGERPDPFNIYWTGDWVAASHAWQTLVDLSENGTILPRLATQWRVSPDGLRWHFKLINDLKWSDGTSMTLEQIKTSLNISKKGTSHTDLTQAIIDIKDVDGEIVFVLSQKIPRFLTALTYVDWAIVHPKTIKIENGVAKVVAVEPCSGPYCVQLKPDTKSYEQMDLIKNKYGDHDHKDEVMTKQGQLVFFDSSKKLIDHADEILSFRSYSELFDNESAQIMKEKGFEIFRAQPTWILKADFTPKSMKSISTEERVFLIRKIQEILKKENPNFGMARATGIIAPHLFGALNEKEFDNFLESLPQKQKLNKPLILNVVTVENWSEWQSYKWFITALKQIPGVQIKTEVLSKSEFSSQRNSGHLGNNFDLIFVPLGVGDPEPYYTWNMVARYSYKGFVDRSLIRQSFFESDRKKESLLYHQLTKELIKAAVMIPIKMDADFVGYHRSVRIGDVPPFRVGLAFYDLYRTK